MAHCFFLLQVGMRQVKNRNSGSNVRISDIIIFPWKCITQSFTEEKTSRVLNLLENQIEYRRSYARTVIDLFVFIK